MLRGGAWKAYDIGIDGVSRLAGYRTGFAARNRRGGIEALIESLNQAPQDARAAAVIGTDPTPGASRIAHSART